jgi:cell division septation protein DedD
MSLPKKVQIKRRKHLRALTAVAAVGLSAIGLMLSLAGGSQAAVSPITLGTADNFAVLAGSGITNTGATTITGDIGTFPTTTYIGSGSVTQTGTNHAGDSVTQGAKTDLGTAYTSVAGQALTSSTGAIAATTLTPGVYRSSSSMSLGGTIVLDAAGNANAVFIFQAGSTITTASGTNIVMINGGQACNVFYSVGSSATLGTGTHLVGNILAVTSITDDGGAVVSGRLLASNGAVTLNNTSVSRATCAVATPTPTPTPTPTATPTPTPTPTATPTPTPTATPIQVVTKPKGSVRTGDGSTAFSR